jgi:hypothetical protein
LTTLARRSLRTTFFLADLDKNCKTKQAEHDANMKMRGEELLALADTIKVLNDDDALELSSHFLGEFLNLLSQDFLKTEHNLFVYPIGYMAI